MKKLGFLIIGVIVLSLSCKKATEDVIDCVVELLLSDITYTVNPDDPLDVSLTLLYAGNYNISIEWEYGDGTTETRTGTETTHRYDSAGNYEVHANITLSGEGHSSCSTSKKKWVDVH